MTIAHCPKCRERVSIPLSASRQARVRCPLCSEEYLLDDALQDLPPTLVLLSDPHSSSSELLDKGPMVVPSFADQGEETVPPLVADEPGSSMEWNLEPNTAPVAAPAFNFEPGSAVSTSHSSTSRSSSASRSRPRRKEGSAMRMIVQTVGGGALGLVIAQLILWWMPGKWAKENRDPFGLAATVAAYVPAIVPASLRETAATAQADPPTVPPAVDFSQPDTSLTPPGKSEPEASTELDTQIPDFKLGEDSKSQPADKSPTPKNQKKKRKADKEALEEFPLPGLNEPAEVPPVLGGKEDPVVLPDLTLDPAQSSATSNDSKMKKAEPAAATPDAATTPLEAPKEKTTEQKLNDAKTTPTPVPTEDPGKTNAAPDVAARLNDVEQAQHAWDTAENPSREKKVELITELFNKLAQLGETTTQVSQEPQRAEILTPVVQKLNSLAEQADKMLPLSRLAVIRLKEDLDRGGLAVGVVVSHQMRGNFHETQLRLLGTDPVITVVSPTDEISQLPANTNIFVLGRWVSNPTDNLAGFEGDAESVLLHGVHALVPAK